MRKKTRRRWPRGRKGAALHLRHGAKRALVRGHLRAVDQHAHRLGLAHATGDGRPDLHGRGLGLGLPRVASRGRQADARQGGHTLGTGAGPDHVPARVHDETPAGPTPRAIRFGCQCVQRCGYQP